MKDSIANERTERKKQFFLKPTPGTGQNPMGGYMANEVTKSRTTFDGQQLEVVENGRPKATHLQGQEITTVSINNKALTEKIANISSHIKIEKDDFRSRVRSMATVGASVYSGILKSVAANIRKLNLQFQSNHDGMLRLNLGFDACSKKFPKLHGVSDFVTRLNGYFLRFSKKSQAANEVYEQVHVEAKYGDLCKLRAEMENADEKNEKLTDDLNETPKASNRWRKLEKLFKIRMVTALYRFAAAIFDHYAGLIAFSREQTLNEKDGNLAQLTTFS